jgi:pimeloyl-ACP methyl ester carboxylesterase
MAPHQALETIQATHSSYSLNIPALPKRLTYRGFQYVYTYIPSVTQAETPTLFLSGAFQSMQSWHRFAKVFAARGKPVIMVDLPGAGQADSLPVDHGLDFLAGTIEHLLNSLGHHNVCIIAASYGTPIAYRFAKLHPDRVQGMVLAGTMKELPSHIHDDLELSFKLLREGKMKQFAEGLLGISGPKRGSGLICTDPAKPIARRKLAYRLIYSQLISMNSEDREKYVLNTKRLLRHGRIDLTSAPNVKTLVFTGEHDCFTLPAYCREVASAMPKCIYTTVKQSDHLFHIEQFETTSELLYAFSYDYSISNIPMLNSLERFSTDSTHYGNPRSHKSTQRASHIHDHSLAA